MADLSAAERIAAEAYREAALTMARHGRPRAWPSGALGGHAPGAYASAVGRGVVAALSAAGWLVESVQREPVVDANGGAPCPT